MLRRLMLRRPGAVAWEVSANGPIPDIYAAELASGNIKDVQDSETGQRKHIAVETPIGPVYVPVGYYLLRTDSDQVFGMTPDSLDEVWTDS